MKVPCAWLKSLAAAILAGVILSPVRAQDVPAQPRSTPDAAPSNTPVVDESLLLTPRFAVRLPEGWARRPGDSGALLVAAPLLSGDGRSIDIYREGVFVEPSVRHQFSDRYAARLSPSSGGIVDPIRYGRMAGREVAEIRLRVAGEAGKLQEHWLFFHSDGVYIFVITTLDAYVVDDLRSAERLINAMIFSGTSDEDARLLHTYGESLPLEKRWLASRHGRTIVLHAPLDQGVEDTLTSIALTRVSTPFKGDERRRFGSDLKANILKGYALDGLEISDRWDLRSDVPRIYHVSVTGKWSDGGALIRQEIAVLFSRRGTVQVALSGEPARVAASLTYFDQLVANINPATAGE